MTEYKYGIFIGRFQPFHNAHLEVIKDCYKLAEKVIVVIGSCRRARTIKNPWTFEERRDMIIDSLAEITPVGEDCKLIYRTEFVPARDYYYNDNLWATQIQSKIREINNGNDHETVLIGNFKDASSGYLNMFPQWESETYAQKQFLNATMIRDIYLSQEKDWDKTISLSAMIPSAVGKFLKEFAQTETYTTLRSEHDSIRAYKTLWAGAPYPPTFVTADSIVIASGHVLVVKRKFAPGKGLYALPGGFIKQNEFVKDAAVRELKEETGIDLTKQALKKAIIDERVFDHPDRSLRGRTITHAYCMKLFDGPLPNIKSGSDADKCVWMQLSEVYENEDKFFDDHFDLITYFSSKM